MYGNSMNIPGYSIASRLGQGGMATVYLAVQHSFEREVALKVMSPSLNSDPSFAARFKREARIAAIFARGDCPNAPSVPVAVRGVRARPDERSIDVLCHAVLSVGE